MKFERTKEPLVPKPARKPIPPRQSIGARMVRMREPYHFQRQRQPYNQTPRPAQPGPQPNQKSTVESIQAKRDYWDGVLKAYQARLRLSQIRR